MKLTVGYVPEHFSTPLFLAEKHGFFKNAGLDVEFKPFPSGSGHLIQCLDDQSINIAVGLTEAFVRGIAAGADYYKIVGTYVQSPLCWAVSTGSQRDFSKIEDIKGGVCGVSRMGSGSDVMSRVLQMNQFGPTGFKYEILNTFANLRNAVNSGHADFFMWEHFTSKKYYESGEIKRIGEIYTPWPSWIVAAHNSVLEHQDAVKKFSIAVNEGISYFQNNEEEGIKFIIDNFDYSEEDAREWLKTVKFSSDAGVVEPQIITNTVNTLKKAVELPENCTNLNYVSKS